MALCLNKSNTLFFEQIEQIKWSFSKLNQQCHFDPKLLPDVVDVDNDYLRRRR